MNSAHIITSKSDEAAVRRVMVGAFGKKVKDVIYAKFDFVRLCFGRDWLVFAKSGDGRPASSINTIPSPVYIDGVAVPHAAIGEVGTLPEYRKQGMATLCLKKCHELFLERDVHLSSLSPFAYYFYRMSGWEIGGSYMDVVAAPEAFCEYEGPELLFDDPQDPAAIRGLYDRHFAKYNGSTVRNALWWTHYPFLFASGSLKGAYIKGEDGAPFAGCIFREDKDAKRLRIEELYFGSAGDFRQLMGSLKKRWPDFGLALTLPADARVFDLMDNPRLLVRTVSAGHQFRVHCPEKALAFLKPRESGTLSFSIEDPFEESPRRFTVRWDGPSPEILPWNGVNPVATTIQCFSRFYNGSVRLGPENCGDMMSCGPEALPLLQALQPLRGAFRSHVEPG
ncbi:MAG: GNAT family N-acetyltransferase [Abditibacteriota bacterium]|nr:GNAT family N-acetyltransferase [Abditibacteriota bacterium]